jgi:hypothetical protein
VASEAIEREERRNPFLRRRMMAQVIAHELGHLVGLTHTDGRGIMHRSSEWLPHVTWTPAEESALKMALFTRELRAKRLLDRAEATIALSPDHAAAR